MLKFSANLSLLFPELELINRFKAAKKLGFEAVEMQFPYTLPLEVLREALNEQQLKLVLFNIDADDLLSGGEGLASVPEKQNQFHNAVGQALEYAKILKPEVINVLPGCCFNLKRKEDYLKTFKENLCFAVETFAPIGIKTVFEAINNHDMPEFIVHNGQQMLDIYEQLSLPNLFMQYDIYHMQMMGDNLDEFIAQHAHKIGHIQFADCPGRGQPGTGLINFESIFSSIEKSDYSGWIGAEYKPVGATIDSLGWFSGFVPPLRRS